MAGRISGITIEIGGDTTKLQTALKGVDGQLRQTQAALRDINKLLKLDPGNTELLVQKQKNLEKAIKETKDRLKQLKDAQTQVDEGTAEWDALQREIIATEQDLKKLEKEYRNFGSVAAQKIAVAGEKMKDLGDKVSEVGQKFKPVSAAAAALVASMGALAYKSVKTADDLNTLSKQTGISTDTLQKMQYAADLIDVPFENISGAVTKLKKNMAGSGEPFEELGVSVLDAEGNMRDAESVFFDTVKALSEIPNEVERDQKAYEIFGKSADELAGIIDDGGAALRKYGDEAEHMGLIMSGETLDALNETNDAIDKSKAKLKSAATRLGGAIATGLVPVIEKLSGIVEKFVGWLQTLTPEQTNLIMTIALVVAAIAPLLIIGGKLIRGVSMLLSLAPMIVSAFTFLISPIGLVVAAIAAAIAIGVLLYKNWDKIKAAAVHLKTTVVEAWNKMKAGVSAAVQSLRDYVSSVWETIRANVSGVVNAIKATVTNTWNAIKTKVTSTTAAIKSSVTNTWNSLKSSVSSVSSSMRTSISNAWNGIKTAVANAVSNVKSSIQGAMDKLNAVKSTAQNVVDSIRGIFSGSISFPHIRLPHFSVYGGEAPYGLGGRGSMPSISVEWYKKAYDNPVMFTSPTVLATPSGYKGFGDGNGAEIVMSLEKLREVVGSNQNVSVNVVLQGDARELFKVVKQTNYARTKATNYNALAVGG